VVERCVFINYRGEDSSSSGAWLYTELTHRLGDQHLFLDAESIPAGADFAQELLDRVRSARILLAVIGPRWLTATDPTTGRRRIDDPQDWIRRELAEAFAAGVRVIPVLTDQAELPAAADLPADIAALSRCQYRHLRRREPTSDLARIVADLTSLDPILAAAVKDRDNAPRQLPAAPVGFVGRVDHLAALDRIFTSPDSTSEAGGQGSGMTVVISAIGGAGGIGKTWLALAWAYCNLHRFPDGQLAVDLRGFSPDDPRPAADVLAEFLAALGVDRDHQPADPDARAALYRTRTTGKRLLIVLDNAATPEQVVPLLPGGTSCAVLVTSRHRLLALLTRHGARPVHLDVLPDTEARALLTAALDDTHTSARAIPAADRAVHDLIALCGGFPLALGVVAARIRTHPDLLDEIVTDLRDLGLDALDSADPDASLPTVLSWSVQRLTKQQRIAFGLLGIAPGPDIDLSAATHLTGLSEHDSRTVLRGLVDASLITHNPGGRYAMHDLVRDYAATTARDHLAERVRQAALERVVDFYRYTTHAADHLLNPHRRPILLDPPVPGTRPHRLDDVPTALAWLDTHHPHLLAAQRIAATHSRHQAVWHLTWALVSFHLRRGHWRDHVAVSQAAREAATHLPDSTALLYAQRYCGRAIAVLGAPEQGIELLHQALALAEHHPDPTHQAKIHSALSWVWSQLGNDRQALEHARHALGLIHPLDQPVLEARMLSRVGWYAARLSDYDTARAHCQAALALHRQHQHHDHAEADTLDSLGYIAHHTGQHTHALDYYRQAVAVYREHGDAWLVAETLDRLGQTYAALGDHEQARAAWRQALQLYQTQQGLPAGDVDIERVQHQLDELDNPDRATGSHK
jgi:tetratricopeptide (TPR) repeat protein